MPPYLAQNEQRVLGCLLEKEALTPESYPLTLNSLRLACNQKTSREPVLDLSEGELSAALNGLRGKQLCGNRMDSRATKYFHSLDSVAVLSHAQRAVLTLLLLRGPQTSGELRGRSGRLHEFTAPAEVEDALESLVNQSGGPWVDRLARRPGEKESRWTSLLGGENVQALSFEKVPEEVRPPERVVEELRRRLDSLEAEVARLKRLVEPGP